MDNAIEVQGLQKTYAKAKRPAVDEIDLSVPQGQIFGLLGPNGAGKTTLVLMLTTLTKPTKGGARVCGHSLVSEPDRVRACLGYCPQGASIDEELSAWENMLLFARLSGISKPDAYKRVQDLFEAASLLEQRHKVVRTLSGGMRRRLEILGALIHRPKLLFLDEPTLGLDPQFRREIWQRVRHARQDGSTVFLTTHYMEEADALCDQVAFIAAGQIKAVGAPKDLKADIGEVVHLRLLDEAQVNLAVEQSKNLSATSQVICAADGLHVFSPAGEDLSGALTSRLKAAGIEVKSLTYGRASLDDVFLRYAGQKIVEESI